VYAELDISKESQSKSFLAWFLSIETYFTVSIHCDNILYHKNISYGMYTLYELIPLLSNRHDNNINLD